MEVNRLAFTDNKIVQGKNTGKPVDELICDRVEIGKETEKGEKGFYELKDIKAGSPADPDPNIIEATNANLDEILKNSELPVMLDFYNPG